MFKTVDKTEGIWVYDTYIQGYVYYFPTMQDALKFLASNEWVGDDCSVEKNSYLDEINLGNDNKRVFYFNSYYWEPERGFYRDDSEEFVPRRYIFVDGDDRCIDFRLYRSQIKELALKEDTNYDCLPKKRVYKKYSDIPSYRFRMDPVPYTGKRPKRIHCLRHMRTTNEKRLNADIEVYDYIRPARRASNLPSLYDDVFRSYPKSWKDCTKKRKQWM